jgi:hypothetical protein
MSGRVPKNEFYRIGVFFRFLLCYLCYQLNCDRLDQGDYQGDKLGSKSGRKMGGWSIGVSFFLFFADK